MKFKSQQVENEFHSSPLLLKIMAEDFADYCRRNFNIDPVMTRVREKIDGSSGVHEDGRAVDFRDEFGGRFIFDPTQRQDVLDYINKKYVRNDGKPSVIHHSFQGAPHHFHLQIATLTKAYMPS